MERIKTSWTWNHKHLLVTLSLGVALIVQSGAINLPTWRIEPVVAYQEPTWDAAKAVEMRAYELYEARRDFDLERYRQEAIQELNESLMGISTSSPFVDYQALKEKYGY